MTEPLCNRFILALCSLDARQRKNIERQVLGWLLGEMEEAPAAHQEALFEYVHQCTDEMRADEDEPR